MTPFRSPAATIVAGIARCHKQRILTFLKKGHPARVVLWYYLPPIFVLLREGELGFFCLYFSPPSGTMGAADHTERMIPMLALCYPKCSTCQKALAWLDGHGIPYELRDIKEQNPTRQELEIWYRRSGLPLKRFFNTSGLLYKSLNLKDRLPAMGEAEQLDLLATDGMLVKRPLLVGEDFVLTGFREAEWTQALL